MKQYALRLPEDLHRKAVRIAQEEEISLNQFFLYAIASKVGEMEARNFLAQRAAGDPERIHQAALEVLDRLPDRPPLSGDECP
jgi:hypothetical protein